MLGFSPEELIRKTYLHPLSLTDNVSELTRRGILAYMEAEKAIDENSLLSIPPGSSIEREYEKVNEQVEKLKSLGWAWFNPFVSPKAASEEFPVSTSQSRVEEVKVRGDHFNDILIASISRREILRTDV